MAESADGVIYVVDASSWISIDGHPASNKILLHLDILIGRGKVKCPREVWAEIRSQFMRGWLKKKRRQIVHSLRTKLPYLKLIGEVANKFPAMSEVRGTRNKADPHVVAYAAYRNQTELVTKCIVVCDETLRVRPNRKIPTACAAFTVECITLLEMMSREFPGEDWTT